MEFQNQKGSKEIDLRRVIILLWRDRKQLMLIGLFFVVLGLFFSVFSEKKYKTENVLIPETSNSGSGLGGNIGGIASLAGIKLGGDNMGSDMFPPYLYPKLLESIDFQLDLMNCKFYLASIGDSISYRAYYRTMYEPGVVSNIRKYTLGLPGLILSEIIGESSLPLTDVKGTIINEEYFLISKEDKDLIGQISRQFKIDMNLEDGFMTLSVEMHDPLIATQMAVNFQKLVHLSLVEYKTKKAKSELGFLNNAFVEKQKEFEEKQEILSAIRDSNFNLSTASAQNKIDKIENEVNLAFQIYSEVAVQKQQAELKLLRDTPLLTVIKPIVVPVVKSGPNRALMIIFFAFLGSVVGCGFILRKPILMSIRHQFSN